MNSNLKMYILVKDSVPLGLALAAVGHASLACYLKYRDDPEMVEWLANSFRKVICKVSEQQFEQAKQAHPCVTLTESALNGQEVALGFKPRVDWDPGFKFFPLYK
jgi:peptidyl-tRNA hydrolase